MTLPDLIPRSVLFGNPTNASPEISPDGAWLAWVAPVNGVLNVHVARRDGSAERVVTQDRDRGVRVFGWAYDHRHLIYAQDVGGDEDWHLYAVDLVDGGTRDLTPFPEVTAGIVALDEDFPGEALVALNLRDERLHEPYHLDLASGELTLLAENPGDVAGWLPDADWNIRACLAGTPDGGQELRVRDGAAGDWRPLAVWGPEESLGCGPLAFARDGRTILLRDSRGSQTERVVRVDVASGQVVEVVGEDAGYDVGGVLLHPRTREVQAVAYLRDRLVWEPRDPGVAADLSRLAAALRGDIALSSRTQDDLLWVVQVSADDAPVAWHLVDRAAGTHALIFVARPELLGYTLARMEPVAIPARDGLTLHGYLTLPPGVDPVGLPAVLLVHGGPWVRDTWGYAPEPQWLANRGYAVLQVNYRGSTGYGKAFLNAGRREWGGAMHDDLVDAVDWLVGRGTAARDRVAIYGGSYGGYAALVGMTFTPDVFACGVDVVGPSSLETLLRSIPPYWEAMRTMMYDRVGDPDADAEFLAARSPLTFADRIRRPLLIAQGANDPRVRQAESEQIVAAMQEHGIPHTYLLFPDEGHGFAKPENRLRFCAAAEAFLAEHLGGRAEP